MSDRADPSEPSPSVENEGRPVIALPPGGPSIAVIAGGCAILGLGLFALLEGRREHPAPMLPQGSQSQVAQLAPVAPPLQIPAAPPPPPPPQPVIRYVDRPGPAPPPVIRYVERETPAAARPFIPSETAPTRSPEPAMVIDLTEAGDQGQRGEDAPAHAIVLHHGSNIVPQGVIIPAVLETGIDSTAPGPVRAITSTDTRGFDGSRVLIPKGSRLYGQYQSETHAGQARVLVTWTKLVRPDGVSIRLNSPAADSRGEPGVPGVANNHIFARVAAAAVATALTVGADLAAQPGNGSIVVEAPVQGVAASGQTLIPTPPEPTITVKEGADISVFVARDLDFSGALPRP